MLQNGIQRAVRPFGFFGWLAVCFLAGCDKVPTWDELTSQKQPEPAPVAATPTPQPAPPVQPTTPMPPPKPSAEEVVAKFKELRPNEVGDSAIASLTSLEERIDEVTEIDASDSQGISSGGMAGIEKLTGLKKLVLDGTRLDDRAFENIAKSGSIEILSMRNTSVNGNGIAVLQSMSNLKDLLLDGCRISDSAWDVIAQLPSLEGLGCARMPISPEIMRKICQCTTLKRFVLNNTGLTDAGIAELRNLENLETLDIGHCQVDGSGFLEAMKGKGLKKFRILSMADNRALRGKAALSIAQLTNLEILNMTGIDGIDDPYLSKLIGAMPKLQELYVSGSGKFSPVTDKALSSAGRLKNLRILHAHTLNGGNTSFVTDATLKALAKSREIEELNLSGTFSDAAVKAFVQKHPQCRLILNGIKVSPDSRAL